MNERERRKKYFRDAGDERRKTKVEMKGRSGGK
jgi:hypothetical protein